MIKVTVTKNSLAVALEASGLLILALMPRLILLLESGSIIESDEAIVGLMGKHIIEGKAIPIFYYGQAYMGSLEAIFAAIAFYILGISNIALKMVPLFFSLIHVLLSYALGYVFAGRSAARLAGLFTAIAPSPLIIWSLKARGGFIETLVIGSAALLVTAILCKRDTFKLSYDIKLWIAVALLLGLGWWTNNQIIFYIAPIGCVLLLRIFKYPEAWTKKLALIMTCVVAFLIAGGPFWYHNLKHKPKWESFDVLFGSTAGSSAGNYFFDYWNVALPIILGARKFWADTELFSFAKPLYYTVYGIIFLAACLYVLKEISKKPSKHEIENVERAPVVPFFMLLLFLVFVPLIFSLSSFGWLSQAPRYLLPLYSVIPVFLGLGVLKLYHSSFFAVRFLGRFTLVVLVFLNLASNYMEGVADEGQPMVYQNERVARNHTDLYEWLDKHGYSHIYTNYWIGYRTAFETKERVQFTRFGRPRSLRIPEYEKGDQPTEILGKVFVLVESESRAFEPWLKNTGMSYRRTKLSHYVVIDQIHYKLPEGVPLKIDTDQISFFIPPWGQDPPQIARNLPLLVDNDNNTRWGSGKAQKAGMAIEIKLDSAENIGRVLLDHGPYKHDMPRALRVSGYAKDSGEHLLLFDMSKNRFYRDMQEFEFSDIPSQWDIRFEAKNIDRLRIELMEDSSIFDWSLSEIRIFRSE